MYGASDELLARTRFTNDENRRIARCRALDHRQHGTHRRVLRDDLGRGVDAGELRVEILILLGELPLLPGAPDEYIDLRHAVWLRHVVVRTELHRSDCRLD